MSAMIVLLVFGLFIGSFLSVVVYRVPRRQSIVWPRSACTGCGHTLGPIDLMPIISYVVFRGRCRYCQVRISVRYPLIEIVTGLLFVVAYARSDHWTEMVAWCLFVCFLLVMFLIDLDHMILPNRINAIGFIAALIFSAAGCTDISLTQSLIGIAIGFSIIFIVILVSKGGMGMGDGKFLAVIGGFLGPVATFYTLFLASFIGASIGITLILWGHRKREDPLPFGPFLALSAFIIWLFRHNVFIIFP